VRLMSKRILLFSAAALVVASGAAFAQVRPAVREPVPSMPIFTPPAASSAPAPSIQHTVDGSGNAVDTTETYRSGPFGTYTDHTSITTAPPGNPSLGSSFTH
jgi:hypothetical protein